MNSARKLGGWAVAALVWIAAAPAPAADLQWSPFRSPEHGFAADFPGAPTLTTSGTPGKDKMVQYEFQLAIGTDNAYEVAVLEFGAGYTAPAPTADIYGKLVEGYAKGSSSTLRTQQPRTIAGQSGVEAVSDDDQNNMHHLIDIVIANGKGLHRGFGRPQRARNRRRRDALPRLVRAYWQIGLETCRAAAPRWAKLTPQLADFVDIN